jgi:hypothetical protein
VPAQGLHDKAIQVAKVPRTGAIAAAKLVKRFATEEAVHVGSPFSGKARRGGRRSRPIRLRARDDIRETVEETSVRVQGLPVGPWVWVDTGTRGHLIGAGRGKRRAKRTVLGGGSFGPVTGPVHHPGTRGRHAWYRVRRRSAVEVPKVFTKEVTRALRG